MVRLLFAAALLLGTEGVRPSPAEHRHEESRMAMGCAYGIVALGDDPDVLASSVDAAFREVDRLDRLLSHYDPRSPLSQINREAARDAVTAEPELYAFLEECLRHSRESGGAFDVTVGPLVRAWGFFRGEGRRPDPAEAEAARRSVGYRHLQLDPATHTVRFLRPGMELDLGGIAKGYAVDRAVAVLRAHGVASALVSAGGSSTYGLGAPAGQAAWEVRVQDPRRPGREVFTVPLRDQALSVSGRSEKSFVDGGRSYSHIMDPRSGRPVEGDVLGVGVVSADATTGDALDDAFFVEGLAAAEHRLEAMPGTMAFFFLRQGASGHRVVHLGSAARR